MRSVRTRRPLGSVVVRMSRRCGAEGEGVEFSARGTEIGIGTIVSWVGHKKLFSTFQPLESVVRPSRRRVVTPRSWMGPCSGDHCVAIWYLPPLTPSRIHSIRHRPVVLLGEREAGPRTCRCRSYCKKASVCCLVSGLEVFVTRCPGAYPPAPLAILVVRIDDPSGFKSDRTAMG